VVSVAVRIKPAPVRLAGHAQPTLPIGELDPRWSLRSGEALLWTSSRIGGTLGLGLDAVPTDGATRRIGTAAGFLTP
jgi:hypothetical protein